MDLAQRMDDTCRILVRYRSDDFLFRSDDLVLPVQEMAVRFSDGFGD